MSTKLSFREALDRPAATEAERPAHSASEKHSVALLAVGPIDRPVDFVRLLVEHGVSMKRARMVLDRLATKRMVAVELNTESLERFLADAERLGGNDGST